jgi:hypothetical protein
MPDHLMRKIRPDKGENADGDHGRQVVFHLFWSFR